MYIEGFLYILEVVECLWLLQLKQVLCQRSGFFYFKRLVFFAEGDHALFVLNFAQNLGMCKMLRFLVVLPLTGKGLR